MEVCEFVNFSIAKKLKEKGFTCEMPFAMYNELGVFHLLTTSAPYNVCSSGYKCREYYDYDDFDEYDYVAPTTSQVLKWLRKEKKIYVSILPFATFSTIDKVAFYYLIEYNSTGETMEGIEQNTYCAEWRDAAFAGIEYCLDNLI